MVKWWVFGVLLAWFLLGAPVSAQELRVRGVLANPSADESTEWIAVENTTSATVSAALYKIRDTMGKVVEYDLSGVFEPFELRIFPRTLSGITLNNDSEGAELLKNGSVQQSVPLFSSPGNDAVWAEVGSIWRYISLVEWLERAVARDWHTGTSPVPSPLPSSVPVAGGTAAQLELRLISPCTSLEWIEVKALAGGVAPLVRVEDSSGLVSLQEELEFTVGESKRIEWAGAKLSNSGEWVRIIVPNQEYLFTYLACDGTLPYRFSEGKWQQGELSMGVLGVATEVAASESATLIEKDERNGLGESLPVFDQEEYRLLATVSSQLREKTTFPPAPVPDFAAEEFVFMNWKKTSLFGSLSLAFAGSTFLVLAAPHLWNWYNIHKDPW